MRPKRTLRRPTRWTAAEWQQVEAAAGERGVPPLRFVREIALEAADGKLPAGRRRARPNPRPRRPARRGQGANTERGAPENGLLERARRELAAGLRGARSWSELEWALHARGFTLHEKGAGLVIREGEQEVSISRVEPSASRPKLERRLGPFRHYAATAFRPGTHRPGYREAARGFVAEVRAVFVDAKSARRAFLDLVARYGAVYAARALRQTPERLGPLQPGARRDRLPALALAGYEYARQRSGARAVLRRAAALLREANEAAAKAAVLDVVAGAVRSSTTDLLRVRRLRLDAVETVRRFSYEATGVFEDDRRALRRVYRYRRRYGVEATAEALRREPGQFGALSRSTTELGLRGMGRPLLRLTNCKRARAGARVLADLLPATARALENRPSLCALHDALGRAKSAEEALRILTEAGDQHMAGRAEALVIEAAVMLGPLHRGDGSARERLGRRLAPMLPGSAAHLGGHVLDMCFPWRRC
jgi:hypothetical protein